MSGREGRASAGRNPVRNRSRSKNRPPQMGRRSPDFHRPDMSDLRIVLLGKSVSENSRVGNFLLGRAAFDSEAPPDVVERIGGRLKDRRLTIINSPRLLQTHLSLRHITQTVRECVFLSDPGPHVIVLLLKHEQCSAEDQECVEKVLDGFSERVYQHSMVFTTQEPTETNDILQKIIQKCCDRHFSLQRSSSADDLLLMFESIVQMNEGRHLVCDQDEASQYFTMKQQPTETQGEKSKLNLVVCGSDGTLKSSISERILQQTDRRSDVELHGRLINLVELPALNRLSGEEVMRQTLRCVSLCDPGVHVFLFIIPDAPFTDEDKAEMEEIQKIFSSSIKKHLMVLIMQNSEQTAAEVNEETQFAIDSFGGRHNFFGPTTQVYRLMENVEQMLDENRGGFYSIETFLEAQMKQMLKFEETKKKINSLETNFLSRGSRESREDLRIVLLGKTGVGKSATGNTILGRDAFTAEESFQSVTSDTQRETAEINGRQVTVIDTPGLFDTELSNEDIKREITNCVSMVLPGPHVFLLLIPLGRFTPEEAKSVKIIQETFGEKSLMYTMVLFTRGDGLKNKTIEQCLGKPGCPLMNVIEACGNRYHVFNNNQPGDRTQVSDLLEKIDTMVNANGGSFYSCKMFRQMEREKQEQQMKILMERVKERDELINKLEEEERLKTTMMEEEQHNKDKERKRREEELKRELREQEKYQKELRDEMRRERETFKHDIEEMKEEKEKLQIKYETEIKRLMKTIEDERQNDHEERKMKDEQYKREIKKKEEHVSKILEEMKLERMQWEKEKQKREEENEKRREKEQRVWDEFNEKFKQEREKTEREKVDLQSKHEAEENKIKILMEERVEKMNREREELIKKYKEEKQKMKMMMEEERLNREKERKRREEELNEREERFKREMKENEECKRNIHEEMKRERETLRQEKENVKKEKENLLIKYDTEVDRLMNRIEDERKKKDEYLEREERYKTQIKEKERNFLDKMKREQEEWDKIKQKENQISDKQHQRLKSEMEGIIREKERIERETQKQLEDLEKRLKEERNMREEQQNTFEEKLKLLEEQHEEELKKRRVEKREVYEREKEEKEKIFSKTDDSLQMSEVFMFLQNYELEKFYNQFVELGIEDVRDFIDGVADEDLNNMNFKKAHKYRFKNMIDEIKRVGLAPAHRGSLRKLTQEYRLYYSFPKSQGRKEILDMDPLQNTVDDLILRICIHENISKNLTVCLFTADGMPLTDDPFFNTWSLNERHIENGSELYAMFTPKENLRGTARHSRQNNIRNEGSDSVFCHVMLKDTYEIHVSLECDTLIDLRGRLSLESGIPSHVLHLKDYEWNVSETLYNLGISEDTVLQFSLSSFHDEMPQMIEFCHSDITPSVKQTEKGLSAFYSALNAIRIKNGGEGFKKVIAYIRKISGCNALAQSLYQIMCQNITGTRVQKIAIVEGLYYLFRELLPSLAKRSLDRIIEDIDVFEHSPVCWAYLMSQAKDMSTEHENYATISMKAQSTNQRFSEPVRVPGVPEVFERVNVLDIIREGGKIPNCIEPNLTETSIKKATDVEKILLSLPPFIESFPLWTDCDGKIPDSSFNINPGETFAEMNKKVEEYSHLIVTPPLQLKDIGIEGPRLVLLSHERFGMYSYKDKMTPRNVVVFDPLAGKNITVNVDLLANELRDFRDDLTFKVTKIPKEAIVVLFDSSSSMGEECFDTDCKMKRIDAIKQIFDSFSNRCMAYNFQQVICLVKFDSQVKTLHTFTETVEILKEYVHALQPSGLLDTATLLYDALNHGCEELNQIRQRVPDCRCRILCLTDGNDRGSKSEPVLTAKKLMDSKIVVDAVLIGTVHNTVLHGISNVTGGCCFKPETSKAALQLCEMETVLSMELRKEKKYFDISSINKLHDLNIFRTYGYDVKPEVKLPPQIHNKVTLTNALKKKMMTEDLSLTKEKRILEELKNLHCDPHPFCTVLPTESDFTFWKILMKGPPDTPYEDGVFELYCEFGPEYPVKPPLVRFFTPVYHCNVNSVGRICHNIFDRNYSAHITMRKILDAIFGLLIAPEPDDPLDSILAEEFQCDKHKYEEEAKKSTTKYANSSLDDLEKKYVGPELSKSVNPHHLICPLSHKLFVDPVRTTEGMVYERSAIEDHVKQHGNTDPQTGNVLQIADLKPDLNTKKAAKEYRMSQIKETAI